MSVTADTISTGLPAIADRNARLLVLGSLPGVRSLEAQEYYAHRRNAFWYIATKLFGIPADAAYVDRADALRRRGVALWDVLHSSHRPGSLDARIDVRSARCNDFVAFLRDHNDIQLIAFNGRKAADLFKRLVVPSLGSQVPPTVALPSTSAAHAAISVAEKCRRWAVVTAAL